jgi:hypothetical protein
VRDEDSEEIVFPERLNLLMPWKSQSEFWCSFVVDSNLSRKFRGSTMKDITAALFDVHPRSPRYY